MPLDLGHVTVCAVGSHDRLLAARALDLSNGHCAFADSILFSHEAVDGTFRNVQIARPASMAEYTTFLLRDLNAHVKTPFVLVTQWDGYVTHPTAWDPLFLEYDYIGAPWYWFPDRRVGNGGFSLRSKRLLEVMCDPQFVLYHDQGEDELICRFYRPILEQKYGIRFAPEDVAGRFAYERSAPTQPTFGFHGLFNFWREVDDAELARVVPLMAPGMLNHVFCAQLAAFYYTQQRWVPLRTLWAGWRAGHTFELARQVIASAVHPQLVPPMLQVCESLLRT